MFHLNLYYCLSPTAIIAILKWFGLGVCGGWFFVFCFCIILDKKQRFEEFYNPTLCVSKFTFLKVPLVPSPVQLEHLELILGLPG